MTRPNGISTNYSYDTLSRLLSVLHQAGASTIDGATYTVDAAGNRTAKTDQRAGVTSNYSYDALYELTQVVQGANTTESYTYDAVGNRLSSLGVSPYNYNISNELTGTPSASYTYDSNGNTLTKVDSTGTTSYAWDFENRLTSVTLPGSGGTVSFKYDPFGRRVYKSSSSGTSVFAYDGNNPIEETNSSGAVVARYSQGLNIDEPLAMLRSGTTSFYNADGLGSITSLANGAGSLTQTYTFDSFGKQTASSGSLTNSFRYTGREFDTETNLYYYRARYYDPSTGRFLSEDPIEFYGGHNFYAYVENDPVNFADETGLAPSCGNAKKPCFAQLKFRRIQDPWEARAVGATHSFWYVQDSNGVQYTVSAGPTGANGTGTLNVWPPNTNINNGADNVSADTWWNSGLSPTNCNGVDKLLNAAKNFPNNKIPYKARGPNSNSAAHYLGGVGGFSPPEPPGAWGWNVPIPVGH